MGKIISLSIQCTIKCIHAPLRSAEIEVTTNEVLILPGYPKEKDGDLNVAYSAQLPGSSGLIDASTLVTAANTYKDNIETMTGMTISQITKQFHPKVAKQVEDAGLIGGLTAAVLLIGGGVAIILIV